MIRFFSSFDIIYFNGSIIFFLFFSVFFCSFWVFRSLGFLFSFIFRFFLEFFSSINSSKLKFYDFSLLLLFFLIFLLNFFSVLGFNFAFTSQVSFCFISGFSFWLVYFFIFIVLEPKGLLLHFIPEGSPNFLVPFLFAIEVIRNLIRPLTLLVRLFANILAGHLLIILLASFIYVYEVFSPFFLFLQLVEFLVSLIQAYIFVTILSLYYSDLF